MQGGLPYLVSLGCSIKQHIKWQNYRADGLFCKSGYKGAVERLNLGRFWLKYVSLSVQTIFQTSTYGPNPHIQGLLGATPKECLYVNREVHIPQKGLNTVLVWPPTFSAPVTQPVALSSVCSGMLP